MKQKILIGSAITAGLLVLTLFLLRLTGALQFYRVYAESNAPTYYPGDYFFAVKGTPKRGDIIMFRIDHPEFGKGIWHFRVAGLPGETVEIRDGIALANGMPVDNDINLLYRYRIGIKQQGSDGVAELIRQSKLTTNGFRVSEDSIDYLWPTKLVKEYDVDARRVLLDAAYVDGYISSRLRRQWNGDHYDPLRLPAGHYFVLADNRSNNALDSRYIGPIPEEDIVGVALPRQ